MLAKLPDDIPNITIGRLPLYLRALMHLQNDNRQITSSKEISNRVGISSAQIRKDLSYFGGFGKQGTGYHIQFLIDQLRYVLHVNKEWQVAVIGIGDLGSAISTYEGFTSRGFRINYLFDNNQQIIGQRVGNLVVTDMEELEATLCKNNIQIVMLAVPAEQAQTVADRVTACDVRAIINYAPISLIVPDNVLVQYIDPVIHLQHMTYYLRNKLIDEKQAI